MRVEKSKVLFLKSLVTGILPQSRVYLFGSRTDNFKKGGDIDILILAERKLTLKEKASIEFAFFKRFGEQKLDLVSYRYDDRSPFKEEALAEGIRL